MVHKLSDFQKDGLIHQPDIQQVITTAYMTKQAITSMGGNDSEMNQIDAIVEKARGGTLSNTEAILNIEAVKDNKHGNGGHGLEG